jgi:hypothetical protein
MTDCSAILDASAASPTDFTRAFCEGVMRFRDEWNPAATEFSVNINGKAFAISDVCKFVEDLHDHLPEAVLDRLLAEMHDPRRAHLKAKLTTYPSYSTAVECVLMLMHDSKAAFRRLRDERFRTCGVKFMRLRE